MQGDLVVVIPGVMGSGLADRRGRVVWGPSAGGVLRALATLGTSLKALELPSDVGDGGAPDGVVPTSLIPTFHVIPGVWTPVQGYSQLLRFLGQKHFDLHPDVPDAPDEPPGNLVLFAYDWRLSNRHTAQLLKERVEGALGRWRDSAPERREARVVFICHSMGGLVARWYIDRLGGAQVARVLVTLGTPHRGAAKTLDQLVNGVRKGPGPLKLDLTSFARSLPSSYQLLPEYACLDDGSGLLKTTELELPPLEPARVQDGMRFHEQLDETEASGCPLIAITGIRQPTPTTASLVGDEVITSTMVDGDERGGDGTVPRLSARPKSMLETDSSNRGAGEGHGALAAHRSVTDQLDAVLTAEDKVYRAVSVSEQRIVGLAVPDLHERGEAVVVTARVDARRTLEVVAIDEEGRNRTAHFRYAQETEPDGAVRATADLGPLPAGGYTIVARAPNDPGEHQVPPVRSTTLVLG